MQAFLKYKYNVPIDYCNIKWDLYLNIFSLFSIRFSI